MSRYKLLVDLPFLKRGNIYEFEYEAGRVTREGFEYPLRQSLAGYLWLLKTEKKYLRKLKTRP